MPTTLAIGVTKPVNREPNLNPTPKTTPLPPVVTTKRVTAITPQHTTMAMVATPKTASNGVNEGATSKSVDLPLVVTKKATPAPTPTPLPTILTNANNDATPSTSSLAPVVTPAPAERRRRSYYLSRDIKKRNLPRLFENVFK